MFMLDLFLGFWLDLLSNFLANVTSTVFLRIFGV
jgi:hypothetical protein